MTSQVYPAGSEHSQAYEPAFQASGLVVFPFSAGASVRISLICPQETALQRVGDGGLVAKSCPTLCNIMDCSPPGSSVHEIFTGKNTGVGSHFLLLGIFPTQVLNPCLQVDRQILYR